MFAAISCMMVANPGMPSKKKDKKAQVDSTAVAVGDSVFVDSLGNEIISTETDTTQMDSLQKAIWKHNKVVDDSIRLDSIRPTTRWYMMPTTRWRISMETRT